MIMPPGKFFTMFHFLEYPFSRGSTHIISPSPYDAPDFDAGFMNVSDTTGYRAAYFHLLTFR